MRRVGFGGRCCALLPLLACVAIPAPAQAEESARSLAAARGAELVARFQSELQQALQEGLAKGPVEAIGACQQRAPEIAASVSRDGARIGRTSHRLRNPANAGPDWVEPVLERYLAEPEARRPRTVELEDGRFGYVAPIETKPLCLTCHGPAIAPELAAEIARRYPEDRATGFEVGDLRGVFWAIPALEPGP